MNNKILVIGGGIAGMEAAAELERMDYKVILVEKEDKLGGKLLNWDRLFPTKRLGNEVLDYLKKGVSERIETHVGTTVTKVDKIGDLFNIELSNGKKDTVASVVLTTGYDTFDARKKEEYGYGIYDNVITSADLEKMFTSKLPIKTSIGSTPKRIAFIHCVGSRDEKVGNIYCSKVCCVTAVKQAIEIKELLPEAEVFSFYMDLRMFGMQFEELYKEAQEKHGVTFIRGRLSEACENPDSSILMKFEDTLLGKQMKMSVDMMVLMVGFVPAKGSNEMVKLMNLKVSNNGFVKAEDEHTKTNVSSLTGVFLGGCVSAPRTIANTITDARAAVLKTHLYVKKLNNN
ncbi:MAG: FAD-dependent oxidoreductase [Bacteroidota bacterium]